MKEHDVPTNLVIKTSDFFISVADPKKLPQDPYPEIAFVGRSNVGKSSLINLLLGRKALAKISGKPGKTRLLNYFLINAKVFFVDLPGYGFAKTSKEMQHEWSAMIEGYLESPRHKLVVQLVDMRHGLTKIDLQSLDWLTYVGRPTVVVLTKADKLSRAAQERELLSIKKQLKEFKVLQVLSCSTKSRYGRDDLLNFLGSWLRREGVK
jgi:GTP-binding protein